MKPVPIRFTNTRYLNEDGIKHEISQVYETIRGIPLRDCRKEQLFRIHERIYREQNGLPPIKPKKKSKVDSVPFYQG